MLERAVSIQPFRGFGNHDRVCVSGQVMFGRHPHVHRPRQTDQRRRWWRRLRDALLLAVTPRVPRARLRIHCGGAVQETETDSHGYFSLSMRLPPQQGTALWKEYLVELIEPYSQQSVAGRGEILVAAPTARHVIVSDIDDTVIFTGVSNKLMMLWRLFAQGGRERVPFPGIAALYQGLYAGKAGGECNPMIYVSRSPWSIYPALEEFFQYHDIPIGPVLQLRDWGINWRHPYPRRDAGHKQALLERVLEVYPDLPLVLIGDSGQHDPELYLALTRDFPDRIGAIYIRDLQLSRERSEELADMQRELSDIDIPLVAAPTTEALARDARERGWIAPDDLERIARHQRRGEV